MVEQGGKGRRVCTGFGARVRGRRRVDGEIDFLPLPFPDFSLSPYALPVDRIF